ncbi:hypothetical protein H1230_26445 [Paenibacillus sp. 19GGS1-52]|uniref:hypothetical protein n=1 Tax=Paenibacillus sp. 19GGS1-52 TaxID=2758563 RepID=UPI001EFA7446|nr:hypothetical protein [Paenibacillus sp. 19GGS1-52]ULO06511.1 hypothetical protein H1230_26445 [Paenibacillus sp. 19GGS1-52]
MKTKDVIYMIYNEKEQSLTSMGIEFIDFINSLTNELNNVLLLASGYTGEDFHYGLRLEYLRKEHLSDLYKENVHHYGDFCWMDFDNVASLDNLEPQEKAELLYLGHYKEALSSPFFEKLNNKYVYLAHDDGWFNKVFYKDKNDFIDVLRRLISNRLKSYKKNVAPLSHDVGEQLALLAKDGILVDLYRVIKSRNSLEIPFSVIGKIMDFDDVYNNMERHKAKANLEYWLMYKNNEWMIMSYR